MAWRPIFQFPRGGGAVPGPRGLDGASILSGPKPPSLLQGQVGDVYIQDSGDLYRKEKAHTFAVPAWRKVRNLTGPAGAPGKDGRDGRDGSGGGGGGTSISSANPTALVGLTAVNGSASTYLRSDGAPALDQSITPSWTGAHDWNLGSITGLGVITTGIHLDQTVDSTALVKYQNSPALQLTVHDWDTIGAADHRFDAYLFLGGDVSGGPNATLAFYAKEDGGSTIALADATVLNRVFRVYGGLTVNDLDSQGVSITAGAASSVTTSAGALTLTAAAASTFSTTAGALTLVGKTGINLKRDTSTLMDVGVTSSTKVTIAANISLSGAAGTGALDGSAMTGDTTLTTGNAVWNGASNKKLFGAADSQFPANIGQVATGLPIGTPIAVVNNSGSTATANDVGYIGTDGKYTTTTTQGADVSWCVVAIGGANAATIYVQRAGLATITCDASNSAGDWLITSSTAGQAHSNGSSPHYAMFAKVVTANSGGAGGTCTALLYCNTRFVQVGSVNRIWNHGAGACSASSWSTTINGAPSATSVVYTGGTDTAIAAAVNASNLANFVLWNTTRGTGRLVTAINTGTKTITTVSTTDSWATTDTITITSNTVTGASPNMVDLDLSQQSTIPATARSVGLRMTALDSGTAGQRSSVYAEEAFNGVKLLLARTEVSNLQIEVFITAVRITNNRFAMGWDASGTSTMTTSLILTGYFEATP